MMTEKEIEKVSKFLSYVLRHHPDAIQLQLDANGWANVDDLIKGARSQGVLLDMPLLLHVVETNNKKRFALNADKTRIRASQGHSVDIELGLQPQQPPPVLYHGTSTRFLNLILKEGLIKGNRQHVHLSTDIATATAVGQRHGKVVVLQVDAYRMAADGYLFYLSDNGVWLTNEVPVMYLQVL
jgi:putative RNA 2'-phosphotransferase